MFLRASLYNWSFFFKQKTAYEIRPRDWSSDVCSSDLLGRPIHPRSRQHVLYFLALYDGHGERERSLYRPNNGHAWHLPASALCRRRLYPSRNERELRRRAVSRWSGQRERRAARKRGLYGHERCCLRFIQRKWSVHLQRSVRLVRKHHAPAERLRFHAILALLHQRDRCPDGAELHRDPQLPADRYRFVQWRAVSQRGV